MTIQQADQYFAALPEGFALPSSCRQRWAAWQIR